VSEVSSSSLTEETSSVFVESSSSQQTVTDALTSSNQSLITSTDSTSDFQHPTTTCSTASSSIMPTGSDYDRYHCPSVMDNLHYFSISLDSFEAQEFCQRYGMQIAAIDNSNLVNALMVSWECTNGAREARIWIGDFRRELISHAWRRRRPWWGGNEREGGLMLRMQFQLQIGLQCGRGALISKKDPYDKLPFICQGRPNLLALRSDL